MQAIEIRQSQEHVAAERLEPAAGVARSVAQHRAAHRVGDARLKFLEAARLALDALAGDQADLLPAAGSAGFEHAQHRRNESRIVLPVAVERDDERRARRRDARAHRRRLAAGLLVPHAAQVRVLRHQPLELGRGAVARAVIDIDDLEGPLPVERLGDFRHQGRDIAGLVAHRHHNGNRWIACIHS